GPRINASRAAFGPRPPFHRGRLARLAGGAGVVWLLRAADPKSAADSVPAAGTAPASAAAGPADTCNTAAADAAPWRQSAPRPSRAFPQLTSIAVQEHGEADY